ncbi:hypothetical protein KI659_17845 [Litoribacter alkaliphilus]|uniref:DUF3467 domain-containing protein n=1 Tax=Litoribacter ruber TaxID=702568 RepID=A0AAP2CJJ8_9BACT|nr:hypothetical protein [Litoribacter alkaliphilus]MBS9525888.1 hypothetical protein [Litoribacter alkaliphilus]
MKEDSEQVTQDMNVKILEKGLQDERIPKYYFNGFINGIGNADILMVLQKNGEPNVVLNTSLSIAKTLAIKLTEMISSIENATGNTIMTTDDLNESFQKKQKK